MVFFFGICYHYDWIYTLFSFPGTETVLNVKTQTIQDIYGFQVGGAIFAGVENWHWLSILVIDDSGADLVVSISHLFRYCTAF
jgi:hypothetical protein